ncbi:uncharacterized protein [Panulirus ornatus]|uniref:uncharacterized protein n=1 Tax=Panulirus ornatus TaxID=150431 RepID=UPI003A8C66B0
MSNSLNSFLVQGSPRATGPYEEGTTGASLSVGDFLTGLTANSHASPSSSTSFLAHTSQNSDAAFLTSQAEASETFLSLSEPSETAETFLSGAEGEVGSAEEVLISGGDREDGEVGQGPLLYLDPATGLHVLVHHLPHSAQETTGPQLQEDDGSREQFVVVGALQSEEEQVVVERPLEDHSSVDTCHTSVGNMLSSHIVAAGNSSAAELTSHQIFETQLESSLSLNAGVAPDSSSTGDHVSTSGNSILNLHATGGIVENQRRNSTLLDCSDAPVLTLQVPDESGGVTSGEIRRDILGIESVPHINLEEIIEKFTDSNSQPHQVIDSTGESIVTHPVGTTGSTPVSNSEENVDIDFPHMTVFKGSSLQQEKKRPALQESYSVKPLTSLGSRSILRPSITVKLHSEHNELSPFEHCKYSSKSDVNEPVAIDEESLYDIVMTYRCKLCSEVFMEKSVLLQHYQDLHKPGGVVKIRVTTSENNESSLRFGGKKISPKKAFTDLQMSNIILKRGSNSERGEKTKELNILSCGFCSQDFVGLEECQEHINKEHPNEAEKKPRKGTQRHRHSQGLQTKYPSQPGMLIGHRKSRTYNQEETEERKVDGAENSKRRIRAPKNLHEQYWLQKQRPKPVFSKEVEKNFKCPVQTCKYKFSSEENLYQHQECHGQPGSSEERVFTCHRCFFKYDKWAACQLHLWKSHGIDIDLLTCGICHTYKTCTQQRLVIHQKTHSDARDHVCKVCGKGFRQLAQLLNHQVLHISSAKDLPTWAQKGYCSECKRWFGDKKTLRLHISAVHLKVKPHACPHCSYRCSRKFDLKVHQRQHTGERPHKCELCGWQCRDHNALRRHKLIHLHLKPLKCPHAFCQFESRHTAYFKRHVAKKHPEAEAIYKCQICSMETPKLQEYISHSTNHEKQLVKEAFKKRSDSSDHKNDVEGTDIQIDKVNSAEKDNIKLKQSDEVDVNNTIKDTSSGSYVFESFSTASNDPKTQVITIKLGNMEQSDITKSGSSSSDMCERSEPDIKQPDQFKQEVQLEESVVETASLMNHSSDGTTALGVVASTSEETDVLNVDGEETIMTLPHVVMSEDGHQYIIGISSDGISNGQTSIFTIQQTEEQQ